MELFILRVLVGSTYINDDCLLFVLTPVLLIIVTLFSTKCEEPVIFAIAPSPEIVLNIIIFFNVNVAPFVMSKILPLFALTNSPLPSIVIVLFTTTLSSILPLLTSFSSVIIPVVSVSIFSCNILYLNTSAATTSRLPSVTVIFSITAPA